MNASKFKSNLKSPFIYTWRAIQKFFIDKGTFHAAALTFYTLFALVPLLGFLFGIAQGFGFEKVLNSLLKVMFEAHPTVYDNLLVFTKNLLAQTQEEVIAGVGFIVLIWSIYKVIQVLDTTFRDIWNIHLQKKSLYRMQQYVSLLLIIPILLVILSGVISVLLAKFQSHFNLSLNLYLLPDLTIPKIVSYLVLSLILTLSYWGLPAIRLSLHAPVLAGFATAVLFLLLQSFYLFFQSELTQYGVVYGSFASIPLFMLWMHLNWVLYLFGAELSFVIDHRIQHKWELHMESIPFALQKQLGVQIVAEMKAQFEKDAPYVSFDYLSQKTAIPKVLLRKVMDHLIGAELVLCNQPPGKPATYLLRRNMSNLDDKRVGRILSKASAFGKVPELIALITPEKKQS